MFFAKTLGNGKECEKIRLSTLHFCKIKKKYLVGKIGINILNIFLKNLPKFQRKIFFYYRHNPGETYIAPMVSN